MRWNKNKAYARYVAAETNTKAILGVSQLDYYMDENKYLAPYFTIILEYLNSKLILLGLDTTMKQKINEVYRIFSYGSEKIVAERTLELVSELEISTESVLPAEEDVPFSRDRFVFAWSNLLSTLYMRLKLQYAYLFEQEDDGECCHCGAKGQTEKDYESWTSGVYPDDEEYDRTNYFRTNTSWRTTGDNYCACQRRSSTDD